MTRSLLAWVASLFFLRLLLQWFFPVVGDEAYYFYWGSHLAGGYYDLPPMIGWWVAPFIFVSHHPFWLRLPNLMVSVLLFFGVYEWMSGVVSKERAMGIAALFFLLPLPYFSLFMFPDLPLLFFGFYGTYLFYRGLSAQTFFSRALHFTFAGALVGAAFLSKYFAVLLVPGFALAYLWRIRTLKWSGVFFILGGFPFLFQHIYWNQNHCWANFVFNLITRQKAYDGTVFQTLGFYLLYLGIMSTPFLWKFIRAPLVVSLKEDLPRTQALSELNRFVFGVWFIPVLLFGVSAAMGKGQGLHWLLFLTPTFVIWVGLRLSEERLQSRLFQMAKLSGALGAIALLVMLFPDAIVGRIFENRFAFEYKLLTNPKAFVEAVAPEVKDSALAFTEGYTLSSVLDYQFKRYSEQRNAYFPEVSVWGAGSRFGRVFDWTTPWKELDGKNLTIITPGPFRFWVWTPFFKSLTTREATFLNQKFYVSQGVGFDSKKYQEIELKKSLLGYYPQFAPGRCSIKDDL